MSSISRRILQSAEKLRACLGRLSFHEERKWIYNPLEYAWDPYEEYVSRFMDTRKRVFLLGMNPGPWGMAQTGIPFGEIEAVTGWMRITGKIGKPEHEHPKRPILGYACRRSEVSGRRLWALMMERYPDPDDFFQTHAVQNYCPLVFMEESGKNLTPDKLTAAERKPLDELCDVHLQEVIELLEPDFLVGIGGYGTKKLEQVSARISREAKVVQLLHPSPASPAANRGWAEAAVRQLTEGSVWAD